MLNSVLTGVSAGMDVKTFLVCLAGSALCGMFLAGIHAYKNHSTSNFLMTLILLPMLVQAVIMMVNGNVGTGVAVAGAFSLVRFRSMPGNSREITSVFAAMAAGLANGMGYLSLSLVMVLCFGAVTIALTHIFAAAENTRKKDLRITIPESLDYYNVFEDIFEKYLSGAELVSVKTTNMGSLYELRYSICEKDERQEKEMIDMIRVRNGNLKIVCGQAETAEMAL
ncbi:MAG: DUF4956 domain-containing protein [Stomatobaculum sp.]|nr:DUF4956 domain-containing protein [Stomatobaculum sp.]